jgi:hypothetical protein
MNDAHTKNSLIFYFVLAMLFVLSFSATYLNLYVYKNFTTFTTEDSEPAPLDFYLHDNTNKI